MIRILFDPGDFRRIMRATLKLKHAVRLRAKNISYQMATDFVKLIHLNISSQKYASSYSPYHPRYEEWKQETVGEDRFWILKGDLLRSLTIWKFRTDWYAGIPAGILDSGGKNYTGKGAPSYIAAYARVMEYGGHFDNQVHPERPVFRPSLHEYKNDGAKKRLNESLQILKGSWK